MTLTEIGRPQVSGGCPYKVLNSQWVLPDLRQCENEQMNEMFTEHYIDPILTYSLPLDIPIPIPL